MVALFSDARRETTTSPTRSADGDVARLSELLPQVLAQYGYDSADTAISAPLFLRRESSFAGPETNRPGIARGRRRVG